MYIVKNIREESITMLKSKFLDLNYSLLNDSILYFNEYDEYYTNIP